MPRSLWWIIVSLIVVGGSMGSLSRAQNAAQAAASLSALEALPACGFTRENVRVGAVILNFDTGAGCIENLDTRFQAASVPKLFIAGAYYEWVNRGLISPSTKLTFTDSYWMGGRNACLTENELGNTYTNTELVQIMINCSDNAATWMLMDSVGWLRVQEYIDSLGIDGIGEVIPYSEVDRRKLAYLDARWNDVPLAMAARFYRRGYTVGLDAYFDEIPERPSREEYAAANRYYFETYTTNTITPRALAAYFLKLREDMQSGTMDSLTPYFLFETMLYTQRLYSTQAMPGDVLVGSKNGFDRGVLAEANLLFHSTDDRTPSGLLLMFAQYDTVTADDASYELPGPFGGSLNDYFAALSPQIRDILYPGYVPPPVEISFELSTVLVQEQWAIQQCWNPYFRSDFSESQVDTLESCFSSYISRETMPLDENLALAVVLRGLGGRDMRMVFIFTAPDGRVFSYQADRASQEKTAVYWFHPLDMRGGWQLDIYMNLRHVYSQTVTVE